MQRSNPCSYGEPQTVAARLAVAAVINTREHLEHGLTLGLRDAGAVAVDTQHEAITGTSHVYMHTGKDSIRLEFW